MGTLGHTIKPGNTGTRKTRGTTEQRGKTETGNTRGVTEQRWKNGTPPEQSKHGGTAEHYDKALAE